MSPGRVGKGIAAQVLEFCFECETQSISRICPRNLPKIYLISPVSVAFKHGNTQAQSNTAASIRA